MTPPNLSPKFLADLTTVWETLQPQALTPAFLWDLKQVNATRLVASEEN